MAAKLLHGGAGGVPFAGGHDAGRRDAVSEEAVHDRRVDTRVEHVRSRAHFDAQHDGQLSRVGPAPVDHCVQRVQPGVAAHAHDIEATAVAAHAQLLEEQGAESRCEQAGGGRAAQVLHVADVHAHAVEALEQCGAAQFHTDTAMPFEQFFLGFVANAVGR